MATSDRHVGISAYDKNCFSCSVDMNIVRIMMHEASVHTNAPSAQGRAVLMMIPRTEHTRSNAQDRIRTSTDTMNMTADNIFYNQNNNKNSNDAKWS